MLATFAASRVASSANARGHASAARAAADPTASQAVAGPDAGHAALPRDGHRSTSLAGDDRLPAAAGDPTPGPGKKPPRVARPRRVGPAIRRRSVITVTTAIGSAVVIGLVIAITTISGTPGAHGTSTHGTFARWAYVTGSYVHSSPAVAGGTVYVGGMDGKVYALDAATGHLRWAYATGNYVDSGPAVAGSTVYGAVSAMSRAICAGSGCAAWARASRNASPTAFLLCPLSRHLNIA